MYLYNLAGISGQRPTLKYDTAEDRCSVTFPGYGKTIAELPMNTVDVVLTPGGMLVYQDDKNELRAVQVPGHREIYDYASTLVTNPMVPPRQYIATNQDCADRISAEKISAERLSVERIKKIACGRYPRQTSSVQVGAPVSAAPDGLVSTISDLALKSIYPERYRQAEQRRNMAESGKPVKEVQITDRSCPYREHKLRVPGEEFTREFLLEQISVLIEQIEEMSHLNAKLSSRIEKTQPKSASSISTQGLSPRSSADPSARRSAGNEETENFEITWSDQGGLPNSLGSPDNPFSRRRPGR